jgi:hypothetical protein
MGADLVLLGMKSEDEDENEDENDSRVTEGRIMGGQNHP